jgi:hypothetical protein
MKSRERIARHRPDLHLSAALLALFELKDDCRPEAERTAAGRYLEPTLFAFTGGCGDP